MLEKLVKEAIIRNKEMYQDIILYKVYSYTFTLNVYVVHLLTFSYIPFFSH